MLAPEIYVLTNIKELSSRQNVVVDWARGHVPRIPTHYIHRYISWHVSPNASIPVPVRHHEPFWHLLFVRTSGL